MKRKLSKEYLSLMALAAVISCGAPVKQNENIIGPTATDRIVVKPAPTSPTTETIKHSIPEGATLGDFNGNSLPFYATIDKVDTKNEITFISFQDTTFPQLEIPKTYGGTISTLTLDGFDRDLLLVTAKLKDSNFNKYFLYVLRDKQWKPVMNGFAIHKNNNPETLEVIRSNPEKPNELLRYYSVFDIDEKSETGYKWLLLEESVLKENW